MSSLPFTDWKQYIALDKQVRDLEKQQRKAAGSVQNWDSYQWRITPTCPPSTSIYFRGGLGWWFSSSLTGRGHYVPGYVVDLADTSKTWGRETIFTHPFWYVSYVVILDNYGLDARETWPGSVPDNAITLTSGFGSPYYHEVETAAEAEQDIQNINMQRCDYDGIPVAAVIFRNNGITGKVNEYMHIDRINRGRSYLFWMIGDTWEMG